tara:strand:- start:331 stop:726 length:396 start_codon:yes stop_codon:yes gene_type:complete
MRDIFEMQAEFLKAGEVEFPTKDLDAICNAGALIDEEYMEYRQEPLFAQGKVKNINELKECIDLMYVCAQYMNQNVGPEIAGKMFDAVHANNMDKFPGGKCIKSESGKILKPEGFNKEAWKPEFLELVKDL